MNIKQSWISKLRIFATISVIWLHVNGTIWGNHDMFELNDGQKRFFAVNFYLMHWAVPVFFMITGYLLLNKDKRITIRDCCFKYTRRVLLALLLFGSFFSAVILLSEGENTLFLIPKALIGVISGKTFSHLWYCYELIGIYAVLPFIKVVTDNIDEQELKYIISILLIFDFVMPFLGFVIENTINFYIPFSYPLFYLLCGHWFSINDCKSNRLVGMLSIVLGLIVALIAYLMPTENNFILGYNSPLIAGLAVTIFSIFAEYQKTDIDRSVNLNVGNTTKQKLWIVDRLCFGTYLIHPLFIQIFYRVLGFTPIEFRVYQVGTIIVFVIVLIMSFAGSAILRKIPILKKYVL